MSHYLPVFITDIILTFLLCLLKGSPLSPGLQGVLEYANTFSLQWGLPRGSAVKKPPAMQEMQETWVLSLDQEDPLEESMTTTPVFLPEESQGWRSLAGYSPQGRRVRHKWSDWAHTRSLHPGDLSFISTVESLNLQWASWKRDRLWSAPAQPPALLAAKPGRKSFPFLLTNIPALWHICLYSLILITGK